VLYNFFMWAASGLWFFSDVINFRLESVIIPKGFLFRSSSQQAHGADYYLLLIDEYRKCF